MKSRLNARAAKRALRDLFGESLAGNSFFVDGSGRRGQAPLAWTVAGDKEIPDQQKLIGYGAARILTSAQFQIDVRAFFQNEFSRHRRRHGSARRYHWYGFDFRLRRSLRLLCQRYARDRERQGQASRNRSTFQFLLFRLRRQIKMVELDELRVSPFPVAAN